MASPTPDMRPTAMRFSSRPPAPQTPKRPGTGMMTDALPMRVSRNSPGLSQSPEVFGDRRSAPEDEYAGKNGHDGDAGHEGKRLLTAPRPRPEPDYPSDVSRSLSLQGAVLHAAIDNGDELAASGCRGTETGPGAGEGSGPAAGFMLTEAPQGGSAGGVQCADRSVLSYGEVYHRHPKGARCGERAGSRPAGGRGES